MTQRILKHIFITPLKWQTLKHLQVGFTHCKHKPRKSKSTRIPIKIRYCHRTNHSISACFKKQRDDEDKKDAYARSKSPQKSFVQYFPSPCTDRTKRYNTR